MITSLSDSKIFEVIKRHQLTKQGPPPNKNIAGLVLRLFTVRITELFRQLLQFPIQWRYWSYAAITLSWLASLQSEHSNSWSMYYHTIMLSPYCPLIIIVSPYFNHIITILSLYVHHNLQIHPSNWIQLAVVVVLLCLQLTLKSFHGLPKGIPKWIHRFKAVETSSPGSACFKRSWSVSFSCGTPS